MSLYIGNLSEHSRRDELERVFRRFGHCNVRIKRDGYGFVVFDFPPDAENCLRALKGKNICGEPLTLTWSNKQPVSEFSRFSRGGRRNGYEFQRGRNSERKGYGRRKAGFDGWQNPVARREKSVEVPAEERGYRQDDFNDYVGEEKDYEGDFPDEGGGVVPNLENNGRWGELAHDPSVDNVNGNAVEFDRYEPYHGHDKKPDNEEYHVGYSGGSPAENSQENRGRTHIREDSANHLNASKFQQTCYRCGDPGHKMRNCPNELSSGGKYKRLDVRRNNKIENKHKGENDNTFRSGSWAKLHSSGDALSMRHHRDERRVSGSRRHVAPLRNPTFPGTRETDNHKKKEHGGKKRSRNEIESQKRSRAKISKQSVSSLLPSDYSASRSLSNSRSPKSLPGSISRSRSRSASSRARSSSSKPRSSSKSPYSKGKGFGSKRSSSPMSLSVLLNQPLSSSPKKIQLNSKSSSINGTAIESKDHLVAQGQLIGSTVDLENLQSEDAGIDVNGNAGVYTTTVDSVEKDQVVQDDKNKNKSSDGATNLTKTFTSGNLSPQAVKETKGIGPSGTLVLDDIPTETQKAASETLINSHPDLSTVITTEEMCMVLNNYGLELPKDEEKNLKMDDFFGCARLWPWHVIYYRRLKKGPISTENYARRVAQNQEFGIVDKYIRSSSGWGEFSLQNS